LGDGLFNLLMTTAACSASPVVGARSEIEPQNVPALPTGLRRAIPSLGEARPFSALPLAAPPLPD